MKPLNDYQKQLVKNILVDKIGAYEDEVIDSASLVNDLGCDSLDAIEIAMELEKVFNIDIPDSELEKVEKVSDIYAVLVNCH
jgi:acyl carrier protein